MEKKIDIISCSINNISLSDCEQNKHLLMPERLRRFERYHRDDDKKRCFVAARLVDYILRKKYGIKCTEWGYSRFQKPYMKDYPFIKFNISHSGDWVFVGVGDCELGIDIETVHHNSEELYEVVCSDKEKIYLNQLERKEADKCFVRIWTAKEAYSKMRGMGLNKRFTDLEVSCFDGNIYVTDLNEFGKKYSVIQREYRRGYWYSVCADCLKNYVGDVVEIPFLEIIDI